MSHEHAQAETKGRHDNSTRTSASCFFFFFFLSYHFPHVSNGRRLCLERLDSSLLGDLKNKQTKNLDAVESQPGDALGGRKERERQQWRCRLRDHGWNPLLQSMRLAPWRCVRTEQIRFQAFGHAVSATEAARAFPAFHAAAGTAQRLCLHVVTQTDNHSNEPSSERTK